MAESVQFTINLNGNAYTGIAQLDRALGYEPRDWGIVLLHSYHFLWVCSSIGLEHSALTRRVASSSLAAPTIFIPPWQSSYARYS